MELLLATNNAGKIREFEAMLADTGWRPSRHAAYRDVDEGDTSYAENAALKAHSLAAIVRRQGRPCAVLGDDSGLEVAALSGRPGVLSARYGGPTASWPERRRKLLDEIAHCDSSDRRARFVCALHFIGTDGLELATSGTYDGFIALEERGDEGFSFDPIFLAADGRTFAEFSFREKTTTSHRARALAALLARLPDIAPTAGNLRLDGT